MHKPLLRISKVADLGFDCTLEKEGGELKDRVTGDSIPLHRRGNLYYMRAWIKQDKSEDFRRQP